MSQSTKSTRTKLCLGGSSKSTRKMALPGKVFQNQQGIYHLTRALLGRVIQINQENGFAWEGHPNQPGKLGFAWEGHPNQPGKWLCWGGGHPNQSGKLGFAWEGHPNQPGKWLCLGRSSKSTRKTWLCLGRPSKSTRKMALPGRAIQINLENLVWEVEGDPIQDTVWKRAVV